MNLVLYLSASAGLATGLGATDEGKQDLRVLYVPSNAQVQTRKVRKSGAEEVSYTLDEPYPAARFLAALDAKLTAGGWSVPDHDPLNADVQPKANWGKWKEINASESREHLDIREWESDWVHQNGALVRCLLRYSRVPGKAAWSALHVMGVYMPAADVESMRKMAEQAAASQARANPEGEAHGGEVILRSRGSGEDKCDWRVSTAALKATPAWSPMTEEVPLSPHAAVKVAVSHLLPKGSDSVEVTSVDLRSIGAPEGRRWFYVVALYDRDAALTGIPDVAEAVVLADGAFVECRR